MTDSTRLYPFIGQGEILIHRNTINESKHTFRPSVSVLMSFCHIICCTLWTSVISFLFTLRKVLDLTP